MKIYPLINNQEKEILSDKFLLLRNILRKNKDKITKEQFLYLSELAEDMANCLYLNIDDNYELQKFRITIVERNLKQKLKKQEKK